MVHGHSVSKQFELGFEFSDTALGISDPIVVQDLLYALGREQFRFNRLGRWYHDFDDGTATRKNRISDVTLRYKSAGSFGPSLARLTFQTGAESVWFTRTREQERVQHWRSYASELPGGSFDLFFYENSALLPGITARPSRRRELGTVRKVKGFVRDSRDRLDEVRGFLHNIFAIGPFRTPPRRRYAFSGISTRETGQTGDQSIDLLIAETLRANSGRPLHSAVEVWLRHLRLARGLDVQSTAAHSNLFEISLSKAGVAKSANIADVGFGFSQVLPVLIQGLLVPRGGLFVVQQPELHLHPDAQAGLADFFIYLASQGIRCLVETHSEYMLVRIRRRLAEGGLPASLSKQISAASTVGKVHRKAAVAKLRRSDVSIVNVVQGATASVLSQVPVNDAFQLENLPEDFMKQALSDRLAIAKASSKS